MDTKRLDGIHNISVKDVFVLSEMQCGVERRRRENRGAERAEKEGLWTGGVPSPKNDFFHFKIVHSVASYANS